MFDNQIYLTPSSFFGLELNCHKVSKPSARQLKEVHKLPDLSDLTREVSFADVYLGWSPQGIAAKITVNQPIERSTYPEFSLGDGAELFIDTRDLKSAGFNTRFCHHFCFLAEKVEGFQAAEVTRFRTEDTHPLCDPTALDLTVSSTKNSYTLYIMIPKHCLYGYEPDQFDRLGFSYRINRWGKSSQHFGVTSSEFAIDQYPSLWPSMRLIS
jgi:hypothetical protein